mmetsp:Transcript_16692/g.36585  ORF Transcript_16692/g.36585 Transcript_16692/m.36585 type:complete len:100 (+) Transcript_16692:150-449(+)
MTVVVSGEERVKDGDIPDRTADHAAVIVTNMAMMTTAIVTGIVNGIATVIIIEEEIEIVTGIENEAAPWTGSETEAGTGVKIGLEVLLPGVVEAMKGLT